MKKICIVICLILSGIIVVGCEKAEDISKKDSKAISTYAEEVSADAQFESNIGLASEQPVFDANGNKIGKRLYVDSSKELLTKESIEEFYNYIKDSDVNYEEIIISMGSSEALQIVLQKDIEVWYCSITENIDLTKIKQIY